MKGHIIIALFCVALVGCDQGKNSPRGFSLPEGNAEQGKVVFVDRQCTDCHSVAGIEPVERDNVAEEQINVKLGGDAVRIKTYAELVTSIINPSHRVLHKHNKTGLDEEGKSKMRNYNDVLTVTELINLVAFLQPEYDVRPHYPTRYRAYP